MMNFGHFLMAFMTLANPEKNTFPVSASLMAMSSLKLAPAQKVLSPPLLRMMTFTSSLFPTSVIVLASCAKILPGKEFCSG